MYMYNSYRSTIYDSVYCDISVPLVTGDMHCARVLGKGRWYTLKIAESAIAASLWGTS